MKQEKTRKKKPQLAMICNQDDLEYFLSHLNPLQTYFCGEILSWIINVIFSEVKSYSCFCYTAIFQFHDI